MTTNTGRWIIPFLGILVAVVAAQAAAMEGVVEGGDGEAEFGDVLAQFDARTRVFITGQVLDEKQRPVPGAAVLVFGPEGKVQVNAKAEGGYRFESVAIGLYSVIAELPAYSVTASTRMEWKWEGVTSVVTERVTIEGVAVDSETGRPLPAFECAEVWDTEVFRLGGVPSNQDRPATHVEDAKGRFTIPVYKPRLPAVVFRAPGYLPYLVRFANDQVGAQIGGMVVPLVRSVVVRGTVVDANGTPIENAKIAVGAMTPAGGNPEEYAVTQSGADGTFDVETGPDATLSIVAYHPEYAPGAATIERNSGGALTARVVLTPGGRIEGTITRDGASAANVLILLKCEGFTWQSTHTDDRGHYEFTKVSAGESEILVDDTRTTLSVSTGKTSVADINLTR